MPRIPMIDTLIAFVDIKEYDTVIESLLEKLEDMKNTAKTYQAENSNTLVTIELGDMSFQVLSNGKMGYAYILHNDLYEIDLAQFRSGNKDIYPVCIKIKSECLWSKSPVNAWKYVYSWIEHNFGEIIADKLSRIDICCHTDELVLYTSDIDTFKGQYKDDDIRRNRRKINGMYFGSIHGDMIFGRIYDKSLEVKQKGNKTWFNDVWKDKGLNPESVWNIEFQIKRDYLKEHSVETVQKAFDSLGTLWEYCTGYWLVKIVHDNSHISRCSTDSRWQGVQKAFQDYSNAPLVARSKQLEENAEAMIPTLYGTLTSYAARKGVTDLKLALNFLEIGGSNYLRSKKQDFKKVVKKKRELLDEHTRGFTDVTLLEGDKVLKEVEHEFND